MGGNTHTATEQSAFKICLQDNKQSLALALLLHQSPLTSDVVIQAKVMHTCYVRLWCGQLHKELQADAKHGVQVIKPAAPAHPA
jgi:hypothetical protein